MNAVSWRRLSIAFAWRPEWPVAVLVGIAWLLLALLSLQGDGGHAAHATGTASAQALAMSTVTSWSMAWANAPSLLMPWLTSWLLMSFAMMVPATLPAVRHVALNSIDARRARAMTIYVVAYLAVWGVFGVVAFALLDVSRTLVGRTPLGFATSDRVLLAIILAIATAWQLTRMKRRAILACKRTVPLPPDGLRADRACARFGMMQAWRCLLACWPLMLLMAAIPHPHPLLPMVALTAIVLIEERARNRDRLIIPIAVLFALATAASSLVAIVAR